MPNYIYLGSTGNTTLRNHLYNFHAKLYDEAVLAHGWMNHKLSTEVNAEGSHDDANTICDETLPKFSPAAFMECLVHFIVADDQVSSNNLGFFYMLTCF
jgi:hypothetical protein